VPDELGVTVLSANELGAKMVSSPPLPLVSAVAVHIAMRWCNADLMAPKDCTTDAATGELVRQHATPAAPGHRHQSHQRFGKFTLRENDPGFLRSSASGWIFAAADGTKPFRLTDGYQVAHTASAMTTEDLAAMSLRATVVTLELEGRGVDGTVVSSALPRALLAAGACAVVAPLWPVPYAARHLFHQALYANLVDHGFRVPAAFAAAVRELREWSEGGNKVTMDVWASFTLFM
jgi:predicted GNAT family acetyltransferase